MSKILSILNQKGGSGKTTTTQALALGLGARGYKVLAVEADPQGNLGMSFGIHRPDEVVGLANLLDGYLRAKTENDYPKTLEYACAVTDNISVVVGNDELDSWDISLSSYNEGLFFLELILEQVKAQYDYILIDCRPSFGNLTKSALIASDEVIVPTECGRFSISGTRKLLKEITTIQKRYNPNLKINGVLPTKIDLHTNLHREFLDEICSLFEGARVYEYIPQSITIAECNKGYNLFEYAPKNKAVIAYDKFIEAFLKGEGLNE